MRAFSLLFLNLVVVSFGCACAAYDFIVAKDGTGDFASIQDAVFACRDYAEREYTIFVKKGMYKEKLMIPSWKRRITITGEDVDSTVVTFGDHAGTLDSSGRKLGTFRSYTCLVAGADITIRNITFVNSAGRVGQAVAMHVEGDRCVFRNCRFIGDQDTLLGAGEHSRQYFVDCLIEGTTDFIFGPSTAVFERCTIISKANSYITAASTAAGQEFGFVFLHCTLRADSGATRVFLGRPWRPYACTAFIQCEMGGHIVPEGWHNWNKPEAELTARYAEYESSGPGASPATRVRWSRQLSRDEALSITAASVLAGSDGWHPEKE
jgi:pectinesterase